VGLISSLAITDSALTAERMQMDVIANNVANQNTTATPQGGPYRDEQVFLMPASVEDNVPGGLANAGVRVARVVQDTRPPRMVYDPSNPAANKQGYVAYPNVDPVTEMTNMMAAQRAYQANITVAEDEKSMATRALDLGRI
jgi:flagellar basal-body rod protein FlgC